MTDPERLPVEGEDVIVIVAGGEPRIQGDRSPIREVKAIQQSLAVVNQRRAVLGPVGRLDRLGRTVHDPAVPGRDVEDLQIAANKVTVRHEPVSRWRGDPDVAEGGAFDRSIVVGADKQSDVWFIAERQVRDPYRSQGVAETGHGQNVRVPGALEL